MQANQRPVNPRLAVEVDVENNIQDNSQIRNLTWSLGSSKANDPLEPAKRLEPSLGGNFM